ncbi:glucose-dependent insulinotropic receptor [Notolabrus celidotus]|uniref:glucose-dependent insulinotropic receptor n=1 Tax=Notolabrus celidotus TaxID=1203425 RepID=UPI00148FADFA|nr:glucose-dependent insulinotropic receptor [Notolabrus celidotus]
MSYLWGHDSTKPPDSMSPDCLDSNGPPALSEVKPRVMGYILSISACFIISTNLLVAAALLKLLLKKSSQSWCFVLNLALADTLVGVAITGLATEDFNSYNITENQQSHDPPTNTKPPAQGKAQCLMRMAFVVSPCIASIMSMFLISLDRYAAIKAPLRYSRLSGRWTAVGSLLVLWISSYMVGFLPVMVRQLQTDGYNGFCAFFSVIQQVDMVVLFSVCFFPVFTVFVYIYLDILKISCSHQKQILQIRQAGSRTTEHHHHQHNEHHRHHRQQKMCFTGHVKALRTVAVLVGCFLILWCPFFVACLVHLLCKSCKVTEVMENHLWLLGLSNSQINPLVYACWQKEVRLQLAAIFSCFGDRSSAAGLPHVTARCNPQQPGLTQAAVSGVDILELSQVQPIVTSDKDLTSM